MPGVVWIPCSRCRAVLRVPAEMIGRNVACKFCHQTFRADPAQILVRDPSAAAPLPLADDTVLDAWQYVVPPAPETETPRVRAEFPRSQPHEQEQSGRILALEQALDRILAEHEELQVELRRLRAENQTLLRTGWEEIERLRGQLVRPAQMGDAIEREPDRSGPGARPSRPFRQPASARTVAPTNGHGRVLSLKPLHRQGSVTRAHSGHRGGAALREALGLLANCERMADQLVTELKTTQQERDQARAAIERVLERLRDDLSRAQGEFETARAQAHPAPGRAAGSGRETGPPTADSTEAAE